MQPQKYFISKLIIYIHTIPLSKYNMGHINEDSYFFLRSFLSCSNECYRAWDLDSDTLKAETQILSLNKLKAL